MKYIVGYGPFDIIREGQGKPFRIYFRGGTKLASEGQFWDFGSARRECEWLKKQGRIA